MKSRRVVIRITTSDNVTLRQQKNEIDSALRAVHLRLRNVHTCDDLADIARPLYLGGRLYIGTVTVDGKPRGGGQ